jgi:predicted SAM-dependent methyltransferase
MKLHLGCGTKWIPGYVHIDVAMHAHVDYVGRVDRLSHIPSSSVDHIYACHVLEHFGRHEYETVLREWNRVLRAGGTLRISVPDFRAVAEAYMSGILTNGIADVIGLCVGGQRDEFDYHKVIFDEEMLSSALQRANFTSVRWWDWRSTDHSHIDDYSQAYLPHLRKDSGRLMSLNLEATK